MTDKYIGKLLDNRYEILQVIGTGGMAVVYKALCHRLNRHVAIKILKDEYAKDEAFRNKFHGESHAVAMLSHPNIVSIYDVSRSNSIEYIVMELIDGMTLKQYMQKRGALSQKEAIHFTSQILKALSHAHSKGIIHRDIKPHNIMLLRDSTVKVADFGIARFEASQQTVTREAFGSVHYISPEQAKGSNIDSRADIYSTGVVLYEMLTGRLPYEGEDPLSIALQHINSLPLSPREINPEIPEALEQITMKAMAPSLLKRYESTDEMLKDLDAFRRNPEFKVEYKPESNDADVDEDETKKLPLARDIDFEEDFDDEDEKSKKPNLPLIAGIVAAGVFLAGAVTLIGTLAGWGGGGSSTKTPDVVGMTVEEASEAFEAFDIIEEDVGAREYSSDFDEGEIIRQSPKAESKNTSGKIYVTVSKGSNEVEITMPGLEQMSEEQAKIVLDRNGLIAEIKTENSDEVPQGQVIKTEPSEGEKLYKGDKVTVYVSLGKLAKETVVPKIIGLTEEKAIEALTAANLVNGNIDYEESSEKKGIVIKQSIAADEKCDEKTVVSFTVSSGKKQSEPVSNDNPQTQQPAKPPKTEEPEKTDDRISVTRSIRLPSAPESFMVKITVDGETQYQKKHSGTDGEVSVTLKGKGTAVVAVYIDDVLRQEISIDFK